MMNVSVMVTHVYPIIEYRNHRTGDKIVCRTIVGLLPDGREVDVKLYGLKAHILPSLNVMSTFTKVRELDVLPHSLPKIHPDCFEQLSPSYIYRSFSLPFFTFDAVQGKCMLIYGVGARHGTPNVFFSYESCAKSCCPNGC
ncbi:hypothetical protein QR680_015772 [Steinernema hermaphroditum]|uniref:Uncharacterized protein n=1 Tax=Steinernema hermaphroditum TaxID=289476 RepID=A0AA39LKT0_9BILA|nr:hypothetical protein QR680_015772 [Steinernema hermaphroditum]